MHILVTGASGRIGLVLTRRLIELAHDVRALVLPDDPRLPDVAAAGAEVVPGDLDRATCDAAVQGVDVVYHIAGRLPQLASPDEIFETNVRGTWNMMNAAGARAAELRLVVFASTNDVYSSSAPLYLPTDEAHPRHPVSHYGLSKVIGEEIALDQHRRYGLPVVIARFGMTQRAHEVLDGLASQFFLLSAYVRAHPERADLAANLAARGEHAIVLRDETGAPWFFQITEADDLVEGLVRLLDHPAAIGETMNLAAPATFATDIAAAHLARRTGLPILDVLVPGRPLRLDDTIGKARGLIGYDPQSTIVDIIDRALEEVPLPVSQ